MPKTYAIQFDFPEGTTYAGKYQGACGFAPTLATADLFTDAEKARHLLTYGYGEAIREWGRVVEVQAARG